jgi:hypothetical protein
VKYPRKIELLTGWGCFFILLLTYWLTVAPTVSYWDCPEYVSAAWLLEVGHPPGNPVWMLVERIITMFAPSGEYAALAVNLSSGLFTAFAGFFLARTIFRVAIWILRARPKSAVNPTLLAVAASAIGALAFGWCDSVWFSAVEAEVYAMSIFMTALCLWLMVKWAYTPSRPAAWRLLILIAYLFGLGIGVHQLNLLLIPALALIWAFKRGIRKMRSLLLIELLSLGAVGSILMGMMPSTISLASEFELFAVNRLGLPFLSGVAAYVGLLAVSLLLALIVTARSGNRGAMAAAVFPALFLSGLFIFGGNYAVGAALAALFATLLVRTENFHARRLNLCVWMLAMLLTGYSSYALIPVRGSVTSPANALRPGEPFSFASYQSREQYGSTPLIYGRTVYSRPMKMETVDSCGKHSYSRYKLRDIHPIMIPNRKTGKYDNVDAQRMPIYTPELNMWFPRLTGSSTYDIASYADWIGADTASMSRVRISEAIDSAGRAVERVSENGERIPAYGYRPTYLQNAQWLATYQIGYMYARYLMWNFSGRQNDIPSQGEVQHGNFITGFPHLDEAMLGSQDALPDFAGKKNPGRNRYWMLPLLFGIIGFTWLFRAGRRGKGTSAIVMVMFVMTGIAIVIYLNQGPGEARERDYSFLGSWMAYAIWIGFGAVGLARLTRKAWTLIIPLAMVCWMGYQNYDDHDRSGRYAASHIATDIIESAAPNAIIFVDGDNGTFPLWYIQEVEGKRTDVRIVNLSYLTLPFYSEMMTHRWRESAPLRLSVSGDSILHRAYSTVRVGTGGDTATITDVMHRIAAGFGLQRVGYVRMPLPMGDTAVIALKNLSKNGSTLDRQRLMILDIVANNASGVNARPIYWLRNIPSSARFASDQITSPWMYGYRFGLFSDEYIDSQLARAVNSVQAPNTTGKNVYMDKTPAMQVASHRISLVTAGARLLNGGHLREAITAISKADTLLGDHPLSYGKMRSVTLGIDTIVDLRAELGRLMQMTADTLDRRTAGKPSRQSATLRERGAAYIEAANANRASWQRYRNALPRRLRSKMAPVL